MLPKSQTKFNKKIEIPKEVSKEIDNDNSFWVITWLGNSYWLDNRIQREVIITNIDNSYYYFNGKEKQFKIFLLEEQTFNFQLGTYFKYNGRFFKAPQYVSDRKSIIKIDDVIFHPEDDYNINGIYGLLNGTFLPPFRNVDDRIYYSAPYYTTIHKGMQIIVPGHVILSYFFYLSTLTIYDIIYGIYFEGLKPISGFNDKGIPIIEFDSEYLRYEEAKHLAKFMLITGGFDALAHIKADFYVALEKCRTDNKKAYLTSKIPYNDNVKLTLIGKQISNNKFIAFAIEDFKLHSGENIFKYESYILKDISDKSSLNEPSEDKIPTTGHVDNFADNPELTSNPTNHNLNPLSIKISDSKKRFYQTPDVRKLEKEKQLNHYEMTQLQINEINETSELIKEHQNKDKISRVNFIGQNTVDYIQVIFDAIQILNEQGYETDYLMIESSPYENVSYPPIKIKEIGSLILASIISDDYNYCLIATSDISARMGLIRHTINGAKFSKDRDPILETCLIKMINDHALNWSEIRNTQELTSIYQNMGVILVHSLNHTKGDHSICVESLVRRLKEYL